MKGRKPLPTALRILRGNPGRHALNVDEPTPPPLAAEPLPHELKDAHARAEWQRLAPGLIACGQVTIADRTLLVAYCQKYGQWLRLEEEVLRRPMTEDAADTIKAIRIANQTLELLMRAAAELGLTPTSRARVTKAATAPAQSKWAGALP
jgi:P27 family predicted phage terminase small subunit